MAVGETLVIAHRGAWGEVPENTLEAFEEAVRIGADMVELDVRRTADGRLIAYHDASFEGVPIANLRHDELRVKDGSSRPPLLADIVRELAGRVALNLELKEPDYVSDVVAILERNDVGDCVITSFLDAVVQETRAVAPQLRTGLVVGAASVENPLTRAQRCDAEWLVLEISLAHHAMASSIPSLVWTVNDAPALDRFLSDPAVAGVITDRPALALERRALLSDRTARAERS